MVIEKEYSVKYFFLFYLKEHYYGVCYTQKFFPKGCIILAMHEARKIALLVTTGMTVSKNIYFLCLCRKKKKGIYCIFSSLAINFSTFFFIIIYFCVCVCHVRLILIICPICIQAYIWQSALTDWGASRYILWCLTVITAIWSMQTHFFNPSRKWQLLPLNISQFTGKA